MLKNDNQNYLNIKRKNEFENKNLNLVNISFNEGVMSQMDVMQGQNKFYELNKVLINRRAAYLIDVITLYKAVGAKL